MEEEGVACSHGKGYKENYLALGFSLYVKFELVSFETRSSAQKGSMAFHKQSRSPDEIFLQALENEEQKKKLTGLILVSSFLNQTV